MADLGAFDGRVGQCYKLSYDFVVHRPDTVLVHGFMGGPDARMNRLGAPKMGHAWVELANGNWYDPVTEHELPPTVMRQLFGFEEYIRYDWIETIEMGLQEGNTGPWDAEYDAIEDVYRAKHRAWCAEKGGADELRNS